MMPATRRGASSRGATLLLAMFFVLILAVIGTLVLRNAGRERIVSAQMVSKERAMACAEAGLQYGRRFFATNYDASNGWNDYLNKTRAGYTWDPSTFDQATDNRPSISSLPWQVLGKSDGQAYDPGADNNGSPQFWVSIHDDDDERPFGQPDNPNRDNNEAVYVHSECLAFFYVEGNVNRTAVAEALLAHIQGASGYGNAQITSNSPDVLGNLETK